MCNTFGGHVDLPGAGSALFEAIVSRSRHSNFRYLDCLVSGQQRNPASISIPSLYAQHHVIVKLFRLASWPTVVPIGGFGTNFHATYKYRSDSHELAACIFCT